MPPDPAVIRRISTVQRRIERAEREAQVFRLERLGLMRRLHSDGWTETRIAEHLGLRQQTVSRILRGG